MHNGIMKKLTFTIAVLSILLGGCITLLPPGGSGDALFVMPCEIANFKNEKWMAKDAEVIIRNAETDQEYRIKLSPNQEYLIISLPSSPYLMDRVLLSVAKRDGGKFEAREEGLSPVAFFLEKNVVYFARYTLHLESGEEGFVLRTSRNGSTEKIRNIYEELKQEYFWSAWEVSPLIGLNGPEG